MDLVLFLAAVVAGLALLTRSADHFVMGAARLAVGLRMSAVVIGAVVVGFGTSAPELLVTALSGLQDKGDIGVGNIIGSNVANLTLVLGIAVLIAPLGVGSKTLRKEAPISTASVLLFAWFVQGGFVLWEALVLLVALVAALTTIIVGSRREEDSELVQEVEEFIEEDEPLRLGLESFRTLVGLVGTLAGAQVLIWGASGVAEVAGLGEGFVGLTLVAIGTSLPELVTAVAAARRDEHDLIVGNLLGSNLFNSLAVGGAAALVNRQALVDPDLAGLATVLMVVVALGAWLFMGTGREVVRWEGGVLLGAWLVTIPLLAA